MTDNKTMELEQTFKNAKEAGKCLTRITDEQRNEILNAVADAIIYNKVRILQANTNDLSRMEKTNPLYDRLMLTENVWKILPTI